MMRIRPASLSSFTRSPARSVCRWSIRISSGPSRAKLKPRCASSRARLLMPRSARIALTQGVPLASRISVRSAKSRWKSATRAPKRSRRAAATRSACASRSSPISWQPVASSSASAWPPVPIVASTTIIGLQARTSPATSATITATCWGLVALTAVCSLGSSMGLDVQLADEFGVFHQLLGRLQDAPERRAIPQLKMIDLGREGRFAIQPRELPQLRWNQDATLTIGFYFVSAPYIKSLKELNITIEPCLVPDPAYERLPFTGRIQCEASLALHNMVGDIQAVMTFGLQHFTKAGGYADAPLVVNRMVKTPIEHRPAPLRPTISHFSPPTSSGNFSRATSHRRRRAPAAVQIGDPPVRSVTWAARGRAVRSTRVRSRCD